MSWGRKREEEVLASWSCRQSSHISDLLPCCAPPTVIPNNKDHHPNFIITVRELVLTKNIATKSYLLPVSGDGSLKSHVFSIFTIPISSISPFHFCHVTVVQIFSEISFEVLICLPKWFFSQAPLISDFSSNLCKLKPCQMKLWGFFRISYLIHITNICLIKIIFKRISVSKLFGKETVLSCFSNLTAGHW